MNRPRKLAASLSLLLAAPLAAADGDPDPSFFSDGQVYFSGSGNYLVEAVAEAPDGRVVVAGTYDGPGASAPQWFWRAIGVDFASTSGTCFFAPPGGASEGRAYAAAFDGAGRLVIAGSATYGTPRLAAARFAYPDCALDGFFDDDGYWTLDVPGGTESLRAIAIHPGTGRIALGGNWNGGIHFDMVVALLSNTGALVSTFNGNGWLTLEPEPGMELDDLLEGIAFTDSGKVIAAGTTFQGPGPQLGGWTVAQLTSTGILDDDFSVDGLARIEFDLGDGNDSDLYGMTRDPNSGKLLLTGRVKLDATEYGLGIARLHSTGSPDGAFSGDGKVEVALDVSAEDIAVDGLGRILVAGTFDSDDFCSLRFAPGGALDSTFGFGGLSVIPFDARASGADFEVGTAIAIQAGRVVVAGNVATQLDIFDPEYRVGVVRLEISLIFADGFESASTGLWSATSFVQ